MLMNGFRLAFFTVIVQMSIVAQFAHAQTGKASYPERAPLEQYMISDESAEIALARTAAPSAVSDAADVMVLRRDGYATFAKGTNGFVCLVVRAWANVTSDAQFWNPKVRAPHCFNAAAAKSVLPVYLMKTKWVLAGKSRTDIAAGMASIVAKNEMPSPAPGTMVYMMSKQQYLNDGDVSWHPHLMFFAAGDAAKSWGANLSHSPVMAAYDPEQKVTTFFVLASEWSDGSPGPPMTN